MAIQSKSEESFETLHKWLETPLGAALLQHETQVVQEALDGIFGEHCLQLGLWGESNAFLRFARTQQSACIAAGGSWSRHEAGRLRSYMAWPVSCRTPIRLCAKSCS